MRNRARRNGKQIQKELEEPVDLYELELEKYIEFVVKEVRKAGNVKRYHNNIFSYSLQLSHPIIYSNSAITLLTNWSIVTGFLIKHPISLDG